MKLLGIDYGDAKVGLAMGDSESQMALPYQILKCNGWDALIIEIQKICVSERIEKIIIGLPVSADSKESMQASRTREFAKKPDDNINVPIEFLDERFSTQQAQKLSPGKDEDDVAAMLILQNYLDKN
jgi:putative holliday junction resolvase